MSVIYGFAPVADELSCVLILGSMPSEASLKKGEYYGHPRNAFWPLMSALFGEPNYSRYEERKSMLLRRRVALWDVAAACEREGSGDSAIRNVAVNDFTRFYASHPAVSQVFFNGGKAYELYRKHVGFCQNSFGFARLGSTSPAHAVSFQQRLEDWSSLLAYLTEEKR